MTAEHGELGQKIVIGLEVYGIAFTTLSGLVGLNPH